jgi:hypothetical protein
MHSPLLFAKKQLGCLFSDAYLWCGLLYLLRAKANRSVKDSSIKKVSKKNASQSRRRLVFQLRKDLLLAEVIEELRLKLRILFSLLNSLEISLNLSKIFFSYSRLRYMSS